ncbi:MAG: tail fiber domain-containing protein [Acetobacter malorum]
MTYGAPTNLDLSACTLSADGGKTSLTLAELSQNVASNASGVASAQSAAAGAETAASVANANAASAQSDASSAITVAKAAQTAVGTPVQANTAGKANGYIAFDSKGVAQIPVLVAATPWVPQSAILGLNTGAVSTAASFSQILVGVSDGKGNSSVGTMRYNMTGGKIAAWYNNAFTTIGPDSDGGMDLGGNNLAFNNSYLKTAPTVTSDANQKTIIGSLADPSYVDGQKLLAAADAVDAKVYKLNAAITEKGANTARLHIGYIAQEWEAALTSVGLDAEKMGLLISYPLTEQQEKTDTDADGKTVSHYETVPVYEADGKTQKLGYSLRYDELQCLLLEARKQKQIVLEARIAALEAKLTMTSATGSVN